MLARGQINHRKKNRNMQTGHSDNMADARDLESGIQLVANIIVITQEQGPGKAFRIIRKQIRDQL